MKKLYLIFFITFIILISASCGNETAPVLAGAIGTVNEEPIDETVVQANVPVTENTTSASASGPDSLGSNPASGNEPAAIGDTAYGMLIPDQIKHLPYYYPEKSRRYVEYTRLNPLLGYDKAIIYVNIGLDRPFYSDVATIAEPDRIDVLVNKYNKLPDDYEPQLEELPANLVARGAGRQFLRPEAKEAFIRMHTDAKELGLDITAFGTYRSIPLQHDIWNRKVNSGKSIEDVDRLNAREGHSEHHTGLAIDVIKNNYSVENTREFEWYRENAHKYGFIIRYPKDCEHITGYRYEPWHLRYLGEDLANAVYESGLTYDEYYAVYIEPATSAQP